MRRRLVAATLGGALVLGVLVGCTSTGANSSHTGTASPSASSTPDPIAGMTLAQDVGQVFMVGTTSTAAQPITIGMITNQHLGNVFLSGRSRLGVAGTASVTAALRGARNAGAESIPLFIATDQEGGQVQVLQGPGFDTMPSGLQQGAMTPYQLRVLSVRWGGQLAAAGVNLDLAPVVDLVGGPVSAASNPPIGAFQREFGYSPSTITNHADAFRAGLEASKVQSVIKHFPGLGFVSANTDTTPNVTDTRVTASGANVDIYRHEIEAGASNIMVSSAIYGRIDPSGPAVFSHAIVTGLLRDTLQFSGLILTDDLSGATQVEYLPPADRAIDAIEAGVDIVLVTKDPTLGPGMMSAVLAKAKSDPAFAKLVRAAARRVVAAKRVDGIHN